MRFIADLHIHSHYSRATSRNLNPENLAIWAQKKGVNVVYFEQKTATSNNVDWLKVNLVRSGTLTSFTERFEDELTGWGMNIGFRLPFSYNNCDLPIE